MSDKPNPDSANAPAIQPKPVRPPADQINPNWKELIYSKERLEQFAKGDMSFRQLHAVSTPDMMEMARIGHAMIEAGRLDDALVIFDGLHVLEPREPYFLTALGVIYFRKGDMEAAARFLDSAIDHNPKYPAALVTRAEAFFYVGKWNEGIADLKTVINADPKNKDPMTVRARQLAATFGKAFEEALKKGKGAKKKGDKAKSGTKASAKPATKSTAKPAKKK